MLAVVEVSLGPSVVVVAAPAVLLLSPSGFVAAAVASEVLWDTTAAEAPSAAGAGDVC